MCLGREHFRICVKKMRQDEGKKVWNVFSWYFYVKLICGLWCRSKHVAVQVFKISGKTFRTTCVMAYLNSYHSVKLNSFIVNCSIQDPNAAALKRPCRNSKVFFKLT